MFRNRTSSQKPGDELYAHFKANFANVVGQSSSSGSEGEVELHTQTANNERSALSQEDIKDLDPTPRPTHEAWRFTPSLMDPNAFAFPTFAHGTPGYYASTPGGTSALYHNQAGDLHTPGMGMGMGLGTPLSMPASDGNMHAATMLDFSYVSGMAAHQFSNYDPFGEHHHSHHMGHEEQSYAPASFMHQDTGYETMEHDGSPITDDGRGGSRDAHIQHHSPLMEFQPQQYEMNAPLSVPHLAEKFRFHVTLSAPTAMVKHSDEIPITYLNKGQAYSLSIIDTCPNLPLTQASRYRTFVRISFEDEQQRQKPATCWQLWKEGRGSNEAHQRGGKLQAVEYVEAGQPAENDDKRTRVELDTASFDGFSVIWTPGANGTSECNIAVRFNFLSTDFSHSKGVKGIPVRLCAKTEMLADASPHHDLPSAEVSFCKVKLFRDHGAERKLSNDVAHVKKTIDKLKQQIAQAESGIKDFGKRKRTGSVSAKPAPTHRPGKAPKHKRTWSLSSASSADGRAPIEEDLHFKLRTMQDMFTSTRPVSVLYLRGTEHDDPDLYPVALVGEPLDLTKVDSREASIWQQRASARSSSAGENPSLVSPSPSSTSLQSQNVVSSSLPSTAGQWAETTHKTSTETQQVSGQQTVIPPDQLIKIAKTDESGKLSGWIEALGVDKSYIPPPDRLLKPVACFYILYRETSIPNKQEYYRAVYLMQRTLKDFTNAVSSKWSIEPTTIVRTLHILDRGLEVEMDDDVIREMVEGQDIVMEIHKIGTDASSTKREWDMAVDSDNQAIMQNVVHPQSHELRLKF